MKKASTMTVRRIGKLQDRQLTIGLDLGDRSSFYCVLNDRGEVILEQKVGTTPEAMKRTFGKMPRSRIALETGTHSPWVSRLYPSWDETIVAHARNVRLIGESRRKDDRMDAQALARLARIDPQLLSPIQHRSSQAGGPIGDPSASWTSACKNSADLHGARTGKVARRTALRP
jgi:transposase